MKISNNYTKSFNSNTFNGILNNKLLLKTLEYSSDNNALISSGITLGMSSIVRPIITLVTPNASKEDKKLQASKSIISGIMGFGLTCALFAPISKSLDNITKNPTLFLKNSTIQNLKEKSKSLAQSKPYNFLKQSIKFSPEIITVLPKAILTAALVIPLTNIMFNRKNETKIPVTKNSINKFPNIQHISFKRTPFLTSYISKIINNNSIQNFAKKYQNSNIIQHTCTLKDIFATACFIGATKLNHNLKEENKSGLIYNATIATGLTITSGYMADKALKKPISKLTNSFIKANKDNPKLYKYLNGIKTLKPLVILSSLYYIIIPFASTFITGLLTKKENKGQ